MSYLESLPRRLVTLYLPLFDHRRRAAVSVLLDGADRDQAGRAAARHGQLQSVLDLVNPTFKHIHKLLFETQLSALAVEHDVCRGRARPCCRSSPACSRPMPSCGCAFAARNWVGGLIFLAYLVPPSILFIPLATVVIQYGLFDSPMALILVYPTHPDPVLDLAADGLFQDHPVRAGGMRADRRRHPLADPDQDHRCRWRSPA